MKSFYLLLFVFFAQASCNNQQNTIVINVTIENFNAEKLFIAQANEWNKPLFWSRGNKGNYKFIIKKKDIGSNPFLASIGYIDSTNKIKIFEYVNDVLSPHKIKYVNSAFFIDTSKILISGDYLKAPFLKLNAGYETKALYRTQMMQFGYLDNDPGKQSKQIQEYLSIIKSYPNSNYLLSKINENKSVLKRSELEMMLNLFSEEALHTSLGKGLLAYMMAKKNVNTLDNIQLLDPNKRYQDLYNPETKLNMLIFWASWCGPCRQEIPLLKKLYSEYANKGLSMTSVSIDENEEHWQAALSIEKMAWKQLIVPLNKMNDFKTKMEIGAIPVTIFLDNKGKIISRTIGLDSKSVNEYTKIINQAIK